MKPVLVLNGPNLNMLGVREPEKYGMATLKDVEDLCTRIGEKFGLKVECRQSNSESGLIDMVQTAREANSAIIINAGGYSHTSVALLDALTLTELPIVEVHITNIHAREEFRHNSYVSRAATATICGCGIDGYAYAMNTVVKLIEEKRKFNA
ncbi:MAG: type II 3-dehydroquinate dehydratase [Alphaproteobacteria bacterium]|nr:type II 3-dehydroquinate dehydratase [Alphaproteobacteria bacterium]